MSRSFTKLFSSITESTVWCEPLATRIVWITMLAMADRKGRVWASIPGLARRAGVAVDETEVAIERFLSPDPYSRTPDHEGRRIESIDGGWRLLNYEKYRAIQDEEARLDYKRDWDRANRRRPTCPTESDTSDSARHRLTQAEGEAVLNTAAHAAETIWEVGVDFLVSRGVTQERARRILGSHYNADKEKLAAIVGQILALKPIDPIAYLQKAMQPAQKKVAL